MRRLSRLRVRGAWISGTCMVLTMAWAQAQTPDLPSDIPEKFTPPTDPFDFVKREEMIPMRDGIKLRTVIMVPKRVQRAPIMLERTPYGAAKAASRGESSH
ncbi:MAG TPA: CocE/NonD family hydrolase, partial [Steroidobacteraceae bacterium]|nr:CocE/NonD family hydrolase [Steroidobacteraceae bacterium]